MKSDELFDKIIVILPDALFDEDETGELIISTGYRIDEDDTLVPMEDK